MTRVVVAMSGGVDSAVAAARCVAAGLRRRRHLAPPGRRRRRQLLLARRLPRRARGRRSAGVSALRLRLPRRLRRAVVRPFVDEYLAGRTPNPCARCNQHVKFDLLWQRARELGARKLATGHYARIATDPATGRAVLRPAQDLAKDQTYFLFRLGPASAARARSFPIGDLTKAEVRAEARALGLPVAEKPESMDVCFVPRGDAAGFVERSAGPEHLRPGRVVDEVGHELGPHDGIHRFTVGQRRGLGLGGGPRRYVRAIDAADGTVTVCDAAGLGADGLVARDTSWSAGTPPTTDTPLAVRLRHRHQPVDARLAWLEDDRAGLRFTARGPAPTPGQAAVFYAAISSWAAAGSQRRSRDRSHDARLTARRVAIATLGCKVNAYDTATIADRLRAAGCPSSRRTTPADVVIVNSCTVTDAADAESRRLARRARRVNPAARVILTGCYAQTQPEAAAKSTRSTT